MTTRSLVAVIGALVSLSLLSGCADSTGEAEDGELGSTASELSTTGKTYSMGTKLETTANLNLRSAAKSPIAIVEQSSQQPRLRAKARQSGVIGSYRDSAGRWPEGGSWSCIGGCA